MDAILEAYVTNLGKYNEGKLVSETLQFPTTPEAVQDLLKRIGIDGIRYEEIFIAGYESSTPGLAACLGEYESLDELNYLAALLSEMDQGELEIFEAALDTGEYTGSVKDLINLTQNLDYYDFYRGVSDDETLGRIYADEMDAIAIPDHLRDYFNYEAYGRDVRLNDDGAFVCGGYMMKTGSRFVELYSDRDDIPPEHRVFSFPRLGIREQMAAYQEVMDKAAAQNERPAPVVGREER